MSAVGDNAKLVLDRAREASEKYGNGPVTVVAASKMNDFDAIREAFNGGIRAFGENRVQEMTAKRAEGAYEGAALHFIGHLQRNKVKAVVGAAELIESVDSRELIRLIGKRAGELGIVQEILLEVNIGGETAKSGVAPGELGELLEYAGGISNIQVSGLMTIPPFEGERGKSIPYFEQMRKLFVDMSAKKYDNVTMSILSMGMSADFEEAIMCGANMVRVGSAIFGERDYGIR